MQVVLIATLVIVAVLLFIRAALGSKKVVIPSPKLGLLNLLEFRGQDTPMRSTRCARLG